MDWLDYYQDATLLLAALWALCGLAAGIHKRLEDRNGIR
jgi:hypothetical protein